jgi:hypothetical protein
MSNRDPFEELLAGLNRPVRPPSEFARSLEQRLFTEFGKSEEPGKAVTEMEQTSGVTRSWPVISKPESTGGKLLPVLEIAAVLLIALGIGAAVLGSCGMLPGQSNGNNAARTAEYPITPRPSECTVAPRPIEEIEALEPENAGASITEPNPARDATPLINLQHTPADGETTKEIEAAYREWIACSNAGDKYRMYAMFTDDMIRSGMVDFSSMENAGNPIPEGDQLAILDISYVREFDDGRAGGVLVIAPSNYPAVIQPVIFIFKREDDRWLIDGLPIWWASAIGDSDVVEGGYEVEYGTPVFEPTVVQAPTITPVDNEPLIVPTITPEGNCDLTVPNVVQEPTVTGIIAQSC